MHIFVLDTPVQVYTHFLGSHQPVPATHTREFHPSEVCFRAVQMNRSTIILPTVIACIGSNPIVAYVFLAQFNRECHGVTYAVACPYKNIGIEVADEWVFSFQSSKDLK